MLALHELQRRFAQAMFGAHGDFPGELLLADGMGAETRLDVYRNNILASLTEVLKARFPAVCRIVDERFFLYAADEFVRSHPPRVACLSEYGEHFAAFLADFPACGHLDYLADLARLEWLVHRAAHSSECAPISEALRALAASDDPGGIVIQLCPSLGFVRSRWPIDLLWRANQHGADGQVLAGLSVGDVCVEVRRIRDEIGTRRLPVGVYMFREKLQIGATLGEAAEAALAADSSFDLAGSIASLFHEFVPGRIIDARRSI